MSSNLMRISLNKQQAIPAFTYLSIAYNHNTRDQIRRLINAGGRDVANSEVMNALEFAWPATDEQERIIMALNKFEDGYRKGQGYLQKLRSLKTGLMQDLLTGKVSVESLLAEQTAVGA
jgi:type I restriction enzyme S subunit